MNRVEIAVTVIGLVATFALPWPAGGAPAGANVRAEAAVEGAQACVSKPSLRSVPVAPSPVRDVDHRSSIRG